LFISNGSKLYATQSKPDIIVMKFNVEEVRIHIQMVINLHKTETKPQIWQIY